VRLFDESCINHFGQTADIATGQPVADPSSTLLLPTSHNGGLALLSDAQLIERLAHFPRERIPERRVADMIIVMVLG